MTDPTYNKESPRYPEVAERDARFVGHEPEGSKMTDRVDRERLESHIEWLDGNHDRCNPFLAKDIRALLAERDALEADNQRLRECLDEAQNAPEPDHNCPAFRHVMDIVGTALAEQEKTDD